VIVGPVQYNVSVVKTSKVVATQLRGVKGVIVVWLYTSLYGLFSAKQLHVNFNTYDYDVTCTQENHYASEF